MPVQNAPGEQQAHVPTGLFVISYRSAQPLLGTLEYGLPHKNLIEGIAAAMHFRSEDDPQAQELAALIADKGPQAALAQISGLDANSEVVSEAVTAYKAMQ